jgi:hypothetical protein
MNDGLKILLERMDTNPEEFQNSLRSNRWESLFKKYEPYLTAEEKAGWAKKVTELNRQAFTNEVMKELLMADGEDEIETALRPSRLIIAPNMQNEALTILAGGGGGGSGNGGGYGGGDSGSVTIKTPTGTHTFTKSGTFTP